MKQNKGTDDYLRIMCENRVRTLPKRKPEVVPYDTSNDGPVRFQWQTVLAAPLYLPTTVFVKEKGVIEWAHGFVKRYAPSMSTRQKRIDDTTRKGQKAKQGLLTDFAALEDGTDEEVCAFIREWGPLSIEAVPTLPLPSLVKKPGRGFNVDLVRPICEMKDRHERDPRSPFLEHTETYRRWARRVRAVQNIARALQQGQSADLEDWAVWIKHKEEDMCIAEQHRSVQNVGKQSDTSEFDNKLAWRRETDARRWADFQEGDKERQKYLQEQELASLLSGWIAVYADFTLKAGKLSPFIYMDIGEEVKSEFWHSARVPTSLLPLGQVLLHTLQSPIVSCKICGRPVPFPKPRVRKDFRQTCGSVDCDVKNESAKNAAKYQRRKQKG